MPHSIPTTMITTLCTQTEGSYSADFVNNGYPYTKMVTSYVIGSAGFNVHYICVNGGSGISCSGNYFVTSIDGKKTGHGSLANRRTAIASKFLLNLDREVYGARYPLRLWISDRMDAHLEYRATRPNWTPTGNKNIYDDREEIFLRSSLYNVYLGNVAVNCKSAYCLFDYCDTRIQQNCLEIDRVEVALFNDYAGGDYTLRADSPIFAQNKDFEQPPFDRAGQTVEK